jgi:hypothetical protein
MLDTRGIAIRQQVRHQHRIATMRNQTSSHLALHTPNAIFGPNNLHFALSIGASVPLALAWDLSRSFGTMGGGSWLLPILTVTIVFCTTAMAYDKEGVLRGVGAYSCAQFGSYYKDDPKLTDTVYSSWARGFMAGMNMQRRSDGKPYRNIPAPDDGQLWVRHFCDRHPLASYVEAVWGYFNTLPELPPKK